jgi:hypothetical protein
LSQVDPDSHPKFFRTSWDAINKELQSLLKKQFEYADPNTVLINLKFDQYTSNMLHALSDKPFGIGEQIESINVDKDFSSIKVKFKGPAPWITR